MFKPIMKRLTHISISCVLALTVGSVYVHADDTEIFFGGPTGTNPVRPNVLLILDSSGSMTATVPNTGNKTRIQVMKEALVQVIQGMEDVNVGLMRFTYKNGGPILFPIRYIDEPAALTVSEPNDLQPTFTYTVDSGSNDAEENAATGVVTLADPVLEFAQIPGGSGTIIQRVAASSDDADELGAVDTTQPFWTDGAHDGARFPGLAIPNGATIVSAKFRLWPNANPGTGGDVELAGHDVDNSPTFVGGGNDITTRTKTSAQVTWNFADTTPEQRDITGIVQEIVSRPGWSSGNALSIISFAGTVGRNFHSFDTDPARAPELEVNFTSGGAATDQLVGLRFSTVDIPQGATVKSAKLLLTSTSTNSGAPGGALWRYRAEKVPNSAAFTTAANDISGRTTTTLFVDGPVPDTVTNTQYESPDLSTVVQEVVNLPGVGGWCGGNPMTFIIQRQGGPDATRNFHSVEGNLTLSAKLEVSYDASTATGCFRKTETAQVASGNDDAEEQSDGDMQRTSGDLDISNKKVGVRFIGIDIPQGATILDAFIDFRSDGTSSGGPPDVKIEGHAHDNAPQFSGSNGDISSRAKTSADVDWDNIPNWTADNQIQSTPDLKTIVEEIVARPGWVSGNAMVFIFDNDIDNRPAESYDGNANQAAVLRVTYQGSGAAGAVKTVRERLIELVNALPTSDWTPIVETFYEAAHYWRGESIRYGDVRDGIKDTRISHPGSYCDDALGNCNGADVTPPQDIFGVFRPAGCSDTNLNDSDCIGRSIKGTPDYISPFNSNLTCVSNYQVLLTDGEANQNEIGPTVNSEFLGSAGCRTQKSDTSAVTSGETCGIDLVEYMHDNDQSTALSNDQTVITYTIGFNTTSLANATQFLTDVATEGGGTFFPAENASDLVGVFTEILTDVKNDPTAFVAPTIATNQFNQLLSRDLLYFGMFTPELEQGWLGNVKKYQLCLVPDPDGDGTDNCTFSDTLDQTGGSALDPSTNQFKSTAQSFWSSVQDGSETTEGGTGAELTDFNTRIIYTETTSTGTAPSNGTSLATAGFQYGDGTSVTVGATAWNDASLAPVRNLVCPSPSTAGGSDCEDRMLWLAGKTFDPESTDPSATTRWATNDVLHSSPGVITYGGEDTDADGVVDTFYDRVLYGTNDGGLHMLNADTGKEEWVFFPQDLLDQQRTLFDGGEGTHVYGLDTPVVLRIKETPGNVDGQIDPAAGEFVHAYVGNRRGGNFYYALDITPTAKLTNNSTAIVPKFLWRIEGGTGDFARLGETWAEPRLATIRVNGGTTRDVLVISGGYTNAVDDPTKFGTESTGGADNLGNAIFLVDPDTGAKIISISGTGSGADVEVPAMKYSIVASPTIFDSDGDSFDDRLFVPDTGGQVFRVDLGTDIDGTAPFTGFAGTGTSTVVGLLASVSDDSTSPAVPADQRRFFHRASVVQVRDTQFSDAANGEFDYVLVGSGFRANPLNVDNSDRLYAFRDRLLGRMADVSPQDHLADTYPLRTADSSSPLFGLTTPISHTAGGDLIDITTQILDTSAVNKQSTGWYFDFASDPTSVAGEKILSSPRVIAGTVFVTSFQPQASPGTDPCAANIGQSRLFNFDLLSAGAAIDWDEDGTLEDVADRAKVGGLGLMSEGVSVYTQEGVLIVHTSGAGLTAELATPGAPRFRTFWADDV